MMDFHGLYSRYARDVHRFALYLSGDAALADDITSETFLRAWSSTAPIREATVKSYLFAIARNVYRTELQRARRHVELPDTMESTRVDPDEGLDQRAALAEVLRALRQLPETDRAALIMRAQDEMPYDEIARALNVSLSSAKVKVHRARLKLAALLPHIPGKVLP
jgi:RNA polymerase sigma-70 factor (ECF subfamily)